MRRSSFPPPFVVVQVSEDMKNEYLREPVIHAGDQTELVSYDIEYRSAANDLRRENQLEDPRSSSRTLPPSPHPTQSEAGGPPVSSRQTRRSIAGSLRSQAIR